MFIWIAIAVSAALCGATASIIAHQRGGDGFAGFVIGLFFGPFGILWAYFLLWDQDSLDARLIQQGVRKLCPTCQEVARPKAVLCPHCQHDFTALDLASQP